jgi:ABC-type amino acid transport substrate-binding protein
MSPFPRQFSILPGPMRTWGPVLVLCTVVAVSAAVVVFELRPSPVSPSRPLPLSSGSWAPFVGPDLPDGGPMTKLVVETLRRAGYSPEVSYTSWSLAEDQVTSGASLGVFPLVGSESRRQKLLLSDPLVDFEYVLFYNRRSGMPRISSAADLRALRVGGIAGYDYWAELESAVGKFVEFESTLEGWQALAEGTIDLLAEGLLSGQAVLADPAFAGDAGDFDYLRGDNPLVHSVEGLYFMMADTPAAADVIMRFNQELAEFRHSDEYERIVADLEPSTSPEVALTPTGRSGLVELLDATGRQVLLAPKGTRARVLAWPEEFTGARTGPPERILVKVKLANGPAQGRVVYVDARAVQLEAAGS